MRPLLLCIQWVLCARRPLRREECHCGRRSGLKRSKDDRGGWDSSEPTVWICNPWSSVCRKGRRAHCRDPVLSPDSGVVSSTVECLHESVRHYLHERQWLAAALADYVGQDPARVHKKLMQCYYTYHTGQSTPGAFTMHIRCNGTLGYLEPKVPFLQYKTLNVLYCADEAAQPAMQALVL